MHDSPSSVAPAFAYFENESDYYRFLGERVSFDGISMKVVSVKPGDNFWKIARKYGVDIDTLIAANPFWESLDASANELVVVPSEKGVLHFIKDLSQVYQLQELYGANPEDIIVQNLPTMFRYYNKFQSAHDPIAVFVRNARPESSMMTEPLAKQFALREMFRSPLGGRYSSFFGKRLDPIVHTGQFHNGVDIASQYGTPVGAACEGVVSAAGWMGGFGKAVMVDHPKGYRTLYGHLSQISVSPGQKVKAGQFVGRVGSTGWSTGPHLHFTLWHNGRPINPMKVLW
jgi:murein DD-endopeptidase MepM/ murein hydrolase activator NlpD